MKNYKYFLYNATFTLSFIVFPLFGRLTGQAIAQAITTLTRQYIPEAMQKDFTQEAYDQWFKKANALYNQLKESKPEALTRDTPSISEQFSAAVNKQLKQLAARTIPLEELEKLEDIIEEQTKEAQPEIKSSLEEIEEVLEKEIEEQEEVSEEIKDQLEEIEEILEKDKEIDIAKELDDFLETLEQEKKQRIEQELATQKEQIQKEQDDINTIIQAIQAAQKESEALKNQYQKAQEEKKLAQEKSLESTIEQKTKELKDLAQKKIKEEQDVKKEQEELKQIEDIYNDIPDLYKEWEQAAQEIIKNLKEQEKQEEEKQEEQLKPLDQLIENYKDAAKESNTATTDAAAAKLINFIPEFVKKSQTTLDNLQFVYVRGQGIKQTESFDIGIILEEINKQANAIINTLGEKYFKQFDKTLNQAFQSIALMQYAFAQKTISQFGQLIQIHLVNHIEITQGKVASLSELLDGYISGVQINTINTLQDQLLIQLKSILEMNVMMDSIIAKKENIFTKIDLNNPISKINKAKNALQSTTNTFINDIYNNFVKPIEAKYRISGNILLKDLANGAIGTLNQLINDFNIWNIIKKREKYEYIK